MKKLVSLIATVLMAALISAAAADQRMIGEVVKISERYNATVIDGGLSGLEWRIPGTTEYALGQFVDVTIDDNQEVVNVQPLTLSLESLYSELFRVKKITYYRCDVTIVNSNGREFRIWLEDNDLEVGDYITAIMYDGETDETCDDSVISIRYERPDLF